ncbi:conjugal transfer protein TraA [Sinorhizobium meliloti]|uniref:Conjugal transfer protein TraA n=1 Tax=Sinorhizobium medicae TaxID=110321 RepID=A0A508WQX6_9HYPH|nr:MULTISPECIES: conjugal transfer protein TraA [Sinorhizobium]ASQ06046.1 conjugal transfer protein TraA [Sinorhizobium meliloti]MDW9488328.1 conjugal transfer protein TraA [Sinorhizobium meliloti]MDW9558750.1 conjugal transfer protein TraA [Sinorhizobium meliloti]MDW9609324.1 conjugal transfer protein TraA [Sinorhizobium meliloti]MDW9614935.1 conjugal transfer protein TraA [Sinorhizobium meliloti]
MEIFFGAFTSEWEQRRAALLHEMSSGGRGASAEEEMRKRLKQLAQLGGAGGGGGSGGASGGRRSALKGRGAPRAQATSATTVARPMEARLAAVAKGSQPAVVKMASYGGGARVGAMLNYVSRGGELKVENESGRILEGREELSRIRGDWDHLFQNRAESRDIGSFSVEIAASGFASDEALHEQVRSTLTSGFGDRRYAYAIAKNDGSVTVQGLVVLRSGQGERLTGDAKAAGIIQGRYDASAAAGEAAAKFSFHGYGNGVEFGASRLRGLVDRHEDVRDDRGQSIANEKVAGDLVQKEWRGELHSRKSRDVMHVIMSARAGTDVAAFEGAVRDFLAHQFAGHRYVFAMHDPASDPKEAGEGGKRPHVHAHAIVAMKSDSGDRIETTPAVFREWRSVMAEKAREHGIEMEMTDRREFASPPAFTRTQVRPVSREGRTEHVGTSEAAQARYDAKRSGRRTVAKSDRSRQYLIKVQESWQKVALAGGDPQTVAYATQHRKYLESSVSTAQTETSGTVIRGDFESNFRINLATLQEMILEGPELREMSRAEFETYEKKVETALFKLERSVSADDRADFDEIAGLARDFVNQKRELVDLYEQRKEALAEQGGESLRSEPRDPANDEWDAAVAKHGEAVVEAGNEAMIEIEHYREGLDRIEAGEFSADRKEEMQAGLNQALERAAQLAIEGNNYDRGVAEQDPGLKRAIEQEENKLDRPEELKGKAASNAETVDEQQRDLLAQEEDRQPIDDDDMRAAHELASTVDATNRLQDRLNKDREAVQRGGETTRTDPAQQNIPRLEELEREQIEQRERDRDDRDR